MDATHFAAWSPHSTSVEFWNFGSGGMLPLRVVALSSTTDSLRKTLGSPGVVGSQSSHQSRSEFWFMKKMFRLRPPQQPQWRPIAHAAPLTHLALPDPVIHHPSRAHPLLTTLLRLLLSFCCMRLHQPLLK